MTTIVIMTLMFLGGRFLNTSMFRQFKSIIVRKKIYQIFSCQSLIISPFYVIKHRPIKLNPVKKLCFDPFRYES